MAIDDVPSNGERVFTRPETAGANGKLLMAAGVGGLCLAALGFAAAVFGRSSQMGLHAMTTVPTILSVGA